MNYKRRTLKNGLRVVTTHLEDNPTMTVLVLVEAGSKYESKKINGVSHFLEHMCFKGTGKRPSAFDISRELDGMGAQSNAFTSHEYTGYYIKAQPKHLKKMLDILSDIYVHPVFNDEEIEKEKGVIADEIRMYEDNPARSAQELFMELLYGDQPAGWGIAGKPEVIQKLNRDDFISYRDKHYLAPATIVSVAGSFDERDILKEIEKKFSVVPTGEKHGKVKVKQAQKKPAIMLRYKKTSQSHIVLGCRAFDTFHKDKPVLDVLSSVLGGGMSSRLFQKIREEMGVGYYVGSAVDTYTDHGFLEIRAGVSNDRAVEVVVAMLAEMRLMRDILVSDEELKKTKDYLTGNFSLGLESSDDVAGFYGAQEVLGKKLRKPREVVKSLRAVTPADIRRVARKVFQDKNLNLAILGLFKDKRKFEKILRL